MILLAEGVNVSGSIVTYNCKEKAMGAVNSLLANTKKYPFVLNVFDNASQDGTAQALAQINGVNVVNTGANLGFGKAHNKVLDTDCGKYIAIINPDITIQSDVISHLVDVLENNSDIVMITPKVLNNDGTEQKLPKRTPTFKRLFLGRIFKSIRNEYIMADTEFTALTDIDFCTGCFFVIRTDVFKEIGGFDDRYFMYMEDADLTRSAKQYGRVVFDPTVSVVHLWERESSKSLKYLMIHFKSAFKYFLKWKGKC